MTSLQIQTLIDNLQDLLQDYKRKNRDRKQIDYLKQEIIFWKEQII